MAKSHIAQQYVSLTGEVIHTLEVDGQRVTTIAVAPCTIDIRVPLPNELHLGDEVVIDAALTIHHVSPTYCDPGKEH